MELNDCGCDTDDQWFDRTICPEPCGMMHTRCGDCGVALGRGCPFEGAPSPELWALAITNVDRTWIEGPYTEDEAMSRRTRLWDRMACTISMARFEARADE